jgi:hypothetical protein
MRPPTLHCGTHMASQVVDSRIATDISCTESVLMPLLSGDEDTD